MTRRDYIAVANAFRAELDMRAELTPSPAAADAYNGKTAGLVRAVAMMADVFAADSASFDRGRFMCACEPKEVTVR